MKKLKLILITALFLLVVGLNACTTQKDCRGAKKHKLSNGIWM